MTQKFIENTIANTGLKVSSLGLGCASFAGNGAAVSEADARGIIARARAHRITYFDTAPFCGHGLSEHLTGDGLRSFEDSLQRLGQDKIDILYLHDIGNFTHGDDAGPALFEDAMTGGYRALESLRSSGVIKAF